jgi:hypothetical protein
MKEGSNKTDDFFPSNSVKGKKGKANPVTGCEGS